MDNQKAKMLGENLAHYKRMQENGTVDIIEFHTTDGQKFGIGNVAAIQLLLSVTVTELERQLHTARFGDIPERLEESREYKTARKLEQALNDMGIDLTGYRFDENEKQLYTQRTVNGKSYELRFMDESDGTQKLIAVLPVLLMALREGRLVIIDELDAKLHPKLLRYVIAMFKNPKINQNGAQLIFTSHDVTTMRNTVFRRDEIWFAAENDNHESEIYSLYEIRREDNERVNNTAAYDKQYLEGRYGADPYLRNMLTVGDWE